MGGRQCNFRSSKGRSCIMRSYLFIRHTVLVASLMLIPWISPLSAYAADQQSGKAIHSASAEALDVAAVGAAPGTLNACAARIPKDATGRQRIGAQQSRGEEDWNPKMIQTVAAR